TGADRAELAAGLAALAAGEPAAGLITGTAGAREDGDRVVFVFPGQGGQWAGMGRDLAASCPPFAERLAECGRALAPYVDWDLEEMLAQDELPDRADVIQPALWAVVVSLAAVWPAAGPLARVSPGGVTAGRWRRSTAPGPPGSAVSLPPWMSWWRRARRRGCGPGCCRWTTPRTVPRWSSSGTRSWPPWPR